MKQGLKTIIYSYTGICGYQTYRNMSELTGKNQAGPTMFSAYQSESPVKICSLLRLGNNFLFVGPSNTVFKGRSFLQYIVYFFK